MVAELAWDEEPAFPFPHRMRIEAGLSERALRIATTLDALDGEVPVAFGFHPWFSPPGAARADYAVELPAMRRLELDPRHLPTGAAAFAVTAGGRRIRVTFDAGFACAQVFTPPDKDLICFEPMTAPADALRTGAFAVAAPGRPFHAAFTIAVDRT